MQKQLDIIRKTRASLLAMVSELTTDQLNEIPTGFNNNIIWNMGHLLAAQQGVCYKRAGLPIFIEEKYFDNYKPDTKPAEAVDASEIDRVKELLVLAIDQFEIDLQENIFTNYTSWINRYGIEINSIEDVVNFIQFHEGLHFGYVMALKRALRK